MHTEEITPCLAPDDARDSTVVDEKAAPGTFLTMQRPKPPKPNRAERRRRKRYLAHQDQLQRRHDLARLSPEQRSAYRVRLEVRCPRCHLSFLGGSATRCQCRV